MIVVTWVVPAILFFVSIFGWEHFVGRRELEPGECMVQFLRDPVFNTSLIIGYYWIPLTILIILYSFIFHSAWTLSKKAADKERERKKLLAALAKKPGSDGTPPQINKKATNTALGIAAMAASLAASNQNQSSGDGTKDNEATSQLPDERGQTQLKTADGIKTISLKTIVTSAVDEKTALVKNAHNTEMEKSEDVPCTCGNEIASQPEGSRENALHHKDQGMTSFFHTSGKSVKKAA